MQGLRRVVLVGGLLLGEGLFLGCPPTDFLNDIKQQVQAARSGQFVETPRYSPSPTIPGGTYGSFEDFQVSITCTTPNATIYYTTDGTTPDRSSAIYGEPVPFAGIGACATIRAFATAAEKKDSEVASATFVRAARILTVAGNGTEGYSGDGGPATEAQLNYATAVGVGSGYFYVADSNNHAIRLINTGGGISSPAGNGTPGYSGDGGPSGGALLNYPTGLAYVPPPPLGFGKLYFSDTNNSCVRVLKAGIGGHTVQRIAGTALSPGYSGDGGPATDAQLRQPTGLAVDPSGNLYIADSSNCCIRMVDLDGEITTIAGDGTAGYVGDGGPAELARLSLPTALALDTEGNLYISDTWNNCVRMIDTSGIISTIAGLGSTTGGYSGDGGKATSARLNSPVGLAFDSRGRLFISDALNNRIRMIDTHGTITTVAGNGTAGYSGDGGAASSAELNGPAILAFDSEDALYVADSGNNCVRKIR